MKAIVASAFCNQPTNIEWLFAILAQWLFFELMITNFVKGEAMEAQQEKVFFDERSVKVTNSRFILPGQKTFAMSGVTAVKTSQINPNRLGPIVLIIIAAIIGYSKGVNSTSLVLAVAGVAWFFIQKTIYTIVLTTSSGEQQALQDSDLSWISRVVAALNDSIIHRG